jgi:beta-aspartyl-peptidase (threonine type)
MIKSANKFALLIISLIGLLFSCTQQTTSPMTNTEQKHTGQTAIAIHGGAGNLKKLGLTPEQEKEYLAVIDSALTVGNTILLNGGTSIEAIESAIRIMEDSPLYNAGKGSVFTHDGINEMDAAIMDGSNLHCGAIAGCRTIKNPISAALAVMRDDKFVMLSGSGAEEFAKLNGLECVDPSYFFTDHRWKQLEEAKDEEKMELDHDRKTSQITTDESGNSKYGTVGCVALDKYGNLSAGTSTGGLNNKRYGRIGDSPIIGAGTYANNRTCAISCTGKGEDFIRLNVAFDISAQMEYLNLSLDSAVKSVIQYKLKEVKGRGGCVAIDAYGKIVFDFTTTGMYRGSINTKGEKYLAIY